MFFLNSYSWINYFKKGGDSLSYLPKITVLRETVKSVSTNDSLVSHSLIKTKGFIINRFI